MLPLFNKFFNLFSMVLAHPLRNETTVVSSDRKSKRSHRKQKDLVDNTDNLILHCVGQICCFSQNKYTSNPANLFEFEALALLPNLKFYL